MQNKQNLIWIDLEMTGLDPDNDVIIEMATIITDSELNTLAEGPVIAVHQSDDLLNGMDEWNTRQHGGSGPDPARAREQDLHCRSRSHDPGIYQAMGSGTQFADLRQQHLPGSPLPL
jgi:oligoribonuclease (3'-5' exoribonuclease)